MNRSRLLPPQLSRQGAGPSTIANVGASRSYSTARRCRIGRPRDRLSPQLNGKVERSHRTDEQEFYQLLTYKGDVHLDAKLGEWERFYNLARPHGAFNGMTPYEALRERL